MKIAVIAIGKPKSAPIKELVEAYSRRIGHYLPFEIVSCRDEKQAGAKLASADLLVVLDERGRQKSSVELADFIQTHQMRAAKRIVLFIGGENGVGKEILERANLVLSLSKMTFPHELVQVILTEQLYRACSIIKGEPYHRK